MSSSFLKNCATLGYIGYLPAPGTVASLVTVPLAFLLHQYIPSWYLATIIISYCIGHVIVNNVLGLFNEADPSQIVIDELVGCLIALYALPFSWPVWLLAFVLFRFFDIYKFGLVAWSEKLPGATGIMVDDVIAGVLSNLCVRLVLMVFSGVLYGSL